MNNRDTERNEIEAAIDTFTAANASKAARLVLIDTIHGLLRRQRVNIERSIGEAREEIQVLRARLGADEPVDLLQRLISHTRGEELERALLEYERSGDHVHMRPYAPGEPCPGGDCWVHHARKALDALRHLGPDAQPRRRLLPVVGGSGAEPWLGGWNLARRGYDPARHGALTGAWLDGYVAYHVAKAQGAETSDDAALAAWARSV